MTREVTGKLKNPCDSLLTDDSGACKEHKSKLDLIIRQTDALIIADALRYLEQDEERHEMDRVTATSLRERILKYGASLSARPTDIANAYTSGYVEGAVNEALKARPKGECRTCKRSSDYSCRTDEDRTRCPIEEHYALPKDGYCHLYERAYEKMEVEHE